eukprot:677424-Hanusia_phi.AAC.2
MFLSTVPAPRRRSARRDHISIGDRTPSIGEVWPHYDNHGSTCEPLNRATVADSVSAAGLRQ